MDLIEKTEELLDEELCDHCLGRLFAQLGHGLSNDERGKSLRVAYAMSSSEEERTDVPSEPENCSLCENLFDEIDKFVDIITDRLESIGFETFLVGCRIDPEIEEKEEMLWTEYDIQTSEPIKSEVNREIGKRVERKVDAEVDLERPDVKAIIDTRFDSLDIEIAPLYVYGRYKKFERNIPQTKWTCKQCWGEGCERCGGTGKMYETSVEELVGEVLKEMTFGEDFTLHGMGREDIDARMLGDGRPFVIEIKSPLKRDVDLEELKNRVNSDERVEIQRLKRTDKDKVIEIKQKRSDKSYLITVEYESPVEGEKVKKGLAKLRGMCISQRTPSRVDHRRSDRVREREIKELELKDMDEQEAKIHIRSEAGTYIKEFIHGDQGRTEPSLAEELGVECSVKELDVTEVHYET